MSLNLLTWRHGSRPVTALVWFVVMGLGLVACDSRGESAEGSARDSHPRLFIDQSRLEALRRAITVAGSHHAEAFGAMKLRVDAGDWKVYDQNPDDGNWNYARSWLAREAALMYLLTDEDQYAQQAFEALRAVHADPDPDNRIPEDGYGLSRAMVGVGFAIAYDWAYAGWTTEQRQYVRQKIEVALNAWPGYRHANIETDHQGSNWVAVTRGGELIMILAAGEEEDRAERLEELKRSLALHLENGYGPSGWSQEGLLYTSYAGQFLLPAIFALQSIGDHSLDDDLASRAFYRLRMNATTWGEERLHLMSGVDGGPHDDDQGWTSILLNSVPERHLPHYRYFYDRYMGRRAHGPATDNYDPKRAGTTWALIFYPEDVVSEHPAGAVPLHLFDDERGAYYFRSGWEGPDDVLVSVMGDYEHHSHAWDVPEAFQLGLIAGGEALIRGPGKDGTGRNPQHAGFSALTVGGKAFAEGGRTGAPMSAEASETGGSVVIGGGDKYRALGLRDARRQVLVDFAEEGAMIGVVDAAADASAHALRFQLNVKESLQVHSEQLAEGQMRTTFGRSGGAFAAVPMAPEDSPSESAGTFRIGYAPLDAPHWTLLVAGSNDLPTVEIDGSGLDAQARVGSRAMRFDAGLQRLVVEPATD